jgi:flagellar biosynthesis protein FlhF
MHLRSFTAPTMREAMDQVRDAMGPDAIIVATHRSERGRGVRVTAALDEPEQDRRLIAEAESPPAAADSKVLRALAWHGAPEALARELGDDLVCGLAGRFVFAELAGDRPLMLVGPPGAGKTTSVAKLAARAALAGRAVALVTTDTVRAGAIPQLEAFASVLRQPLAAASSPEELHAALLSARAAGPRRDVLIDTPGANPFNRDEMADLARFLRVCEVEPVLVLPAGGDPGDAADIAQAFAALGCRKLIATRLDGARRYGSLLAAAAAGGLAFTEASCTPSVAQGFRKVSVANLARLLADDPSRRDAASVLGE